MTNFTRSARTPGGRRAISVLAIAVVVFVAIGIAVELVFLPKASSSSSATTTLASGATSSIYCSTPSSSCPTPSTTVQTAVTQWIADFNSRNVEGLGNFYTTDALVVWSGQASGLAGTYNGQGNIRILYGSSIGKTTSLNASIANVVAKALSPDEYNVTLALAMKGNSSVVGALAITVNANQLWNYVGGQWQIAKETWNYVTFSEQFPVSATTFPQWTAMKEGQNPNLVSEKSFEWNAGPYVAASVYAFLFGVLALGVLRIRKRSQS
jgi:ketosteroid isomerase-like protein